MTLELKKFMVFLNIVLIANSAQGQNNLTGRIIDSKGNPISFVNIGILNKAVGTVSDEKGNFTLSFGDDLLFDTMAVSCIGFKFQKYTVKYFMDSLSKNRNIIMQSDVVQLQEVLIKGNKVKSHRIGYYTNSFQYRGYMTSRAKGAELATFIHQKKNKTSHLIAFEFDIIENHYDSLLFRINIYSVKNEMPDSNLLKRNEVFLLLGQHDKFKYLFKHNIFVTGDFIVSLELIDNFGQGNSQEVFEFASEEGGIYYKRYTSHDKWKKFYGASLGYGLIVN